MRSSCCSRSLSTVTLCNPLEILQCRLVGDTRRRTGVALPWQLLSIFACCTSCNAQLRCDLGRFQSTLPRAAGAIRTCLWYHYWTVAYSRLILTLARPAGLWTWGHHCCQVLAHGSRTVLIMRTLCPTQSCQEPMAAFTSSLMLQELVRLLRLLLTSVPHLYLMYIHYVSPVVFAACWPHSHSCNSAPVANLHSHELLVACLCA